MRLRKLPQQLPQPISPEVARLLRILDQEGSIKSTDQLVFTEKAVLCRLVTQFLQSAREESTYLPFGSRDFDIAYRTLLEQCLAIEAAPAIPADELLIAEEEEIQDLHWDGTGLEGLDEVLHGFEGRGIVELTGRGGAGKSLLSLHIVLRHLSRDPSVTCTWIDTRASFSALRAQQILQALAISEAESVLDRLNIVDCFDVDALRSVLREIEGSLAFNSLANPSVNVDHDNHGATMIDQTNTVSPQSVRIIVVDTLSNILAPLITGSTSQGYAEIHALMEGLQDMSRRYNLLTLITQTPVSAVPTFPASAFSTTSIKPPLGVSFTYFPDISVLLQKSTDVFVMDVYEGSMMAARQQPTSTVTADGAAAPEKGWDESRIVAEVIKNRTGPSSTWVMFHTDGIRLQDVTAK